jgi:hypothetical protein
MLFHMDQVNGDQLVGWVAPDNPSALPRIKIIRPNGPDIELEANTLRTDLQDRGHHDTGMVGFVINEKIVPGFSKLIDEIEIRECDSNVLIYRKFQEGKHIEKKLFRFELQALPDPKIEALFTSHFALYYGMVQNFPFDTFFGIVNNPPARSIYISGRPNFQQYEQLFRDHDFKIVTLIRDPYEEMAERLLFARYASNENVPPFVADHISGLEPLIDLVKDVNFGEAESIAAAFNLMTEAQRKILSNPLVGSLACPVDEFPRRGHIEIALSKLSRMDLVGLRSRFGEFKSILGEILGVDILADYEITNLSWVSRIAEHLSKIKQAKNLISLDLELYFFVEEAIKEALPTVAS